MGQAPSVTLSLLCGNSPLQVGDSSHAVHSAAVPLQTVRLKLWPGSKRTICHAELPERECISLLVDGLCPFEFGLPGKRAAEQRQRLTAAGGRFQQSVLTVLNGFNELVHEHELHAIRVARKCDLMPSDGVLLRVFEQCIVVHKLNRWYVLIHPRNLRVAADLVT